MPAKKTVRKKRKTGMGKDLARGVSDVKTRKKRIGREMDAIDRAFKRKKRR